MKYIIEVPDKGNISIRKDGWILRHNGIIAISLPESELQEYKHEDADVNDNSNDKWKIIIGLLKEIKALCMARCNIRTELPDELNKAIERLEFIIKHE